MEKQDTHADRCDGCAEAIQVMLHKPAAKQHGRTDDHRHPKRNSRDQTEHKLPRAHLEQTGAEISSYAQPWRETADEHGSRTAPCDPDLTVPEFLRSDPPLNPF